MSSCEKLKWLFYYYTKSDKGRFELSHIVELFCFLGVSILLLETVLYLWLNG